MRKRLYFRILAGLLLVSTFIVVLSSVYTLRTLRTAASLALEQRLKDAALAAGSIAAALPADAGAALQGLVGRIGERTGLRITLVDAGGAVLADSRHDPDSLENHAGRPEIAAARGGDVGIATRFSTTERQWMVYVAVPAGAPGEAPAQGGEGGSLVARASAPRAGLEAAALHARGEIALFAALLLAACLLVALAISRSIASPLRELAGIAARFAGGELGARLYLRGRDEVRGLADSFNSMGERLQQLFEESSARARELDGIFSSVRQGIVVIDGEGRIARSNRGFDELARSGPATGRLLVEVLPVTRLHELVGSARQSGQRQTEELTLGGQTVLCSVEGMAGTGELILLLQDTSEVGKLEEVKRDFVANASHELRTPLTTIRGALEMLGESGCDPEGGRWVDAMRRNAERMAAIVEDLLTLSRLEYKEAGIEAARVDMLRVARDSAALFAHRFQARAIRLALELPDVLPRVQGDAFLLEQMLVNLLDNALKYTEAGEVRLRCAAEENGGVLVEVSDTGIGIPAHHLGRIFERFYVVDKSRSRTMGGTGLGLSIVKHIVQRHGGTIAVQSLPGSGTRFTVHLPAQGSP